MRTVRRSTSGTWLVEECTGTAQELHDKDADFHGRLVRINTVTESSLVLGSTQKLDQVDLDAAERLGLHLARRRSGGGAVHLPPGDHCWIDLFVPVDDPLWVDDVSISSRWLGECWASVVRSHNSGHVDIHGGALANRELGRTVCFASIGPGEVVVDGRKVVGISQRRTRLGARFQCVVYLRWDPAPMLESLRLGPRSGEVSAVLMEAVSPIHSTSSPVDAPVAAGRWDVVEELLANLP